MADAKQAQLLGRSWVGQQGGKVRFLPLIGADLVDQPVALAAQGQVGIKMGQNGGHHQSGQQGTKGEQNTDETKQSNDILKQADQQPECLAHAKANSFVGQADFVVHFRVFKVGYPLKAVYPGVNVALYPFSRLPLQFTLKILHGRLAQFPAKND